MGRTLASWCVLVVVGGLTGCSMCQSPFDYCAPVLGANGCPNCNFQARRGSIFVPMDDSAVATVPRGPTPASQSAEPDEALPEDSAPDLTAETQGESVTR